MSIAMGYPFGARSRSPASLPRNRMARPVDKPLQQRCGWFLLVSFAVAVTVAAEDRAIRGTSCFVAGPTLATSSAPSFIAVGDLNADGNSDLAVANGVPNGVSVFFGDGAGGFGPPSNLSVGSGNSAVAIADFNGDGILDLAVGKVSGVPTGADDLSILLGTGGGNFAPVQNFGIGSSLSQFWASIAVADFNRDGSLDVALGYTNVNGVSIFLGNGAGSFSFAGTFTTFFQSLFSIAAGDFNGDGNPDVAGTLDFAGHVAVFLGTGTGSLGAPTDFPAGILPIGVAAGDLNGDGRLDLAVANEGGNTVSILLGNGAGGFAAPVSFPVGQASRAVLLADFDRDGRLDVAVVNEFSANVSVLLGDGNGGLGPAGNFGAGTIPVGLAAGDFDRDGLPDLAVASSGANTVSILINAAPTVLPDSLPAGVVSGTYPTTQFSASGGTAPYTFAVSGTLPPGLSFDVSTATLSGMPAQLGTSTFSVTATDAGGCSSTRSYSVTVGRALTIVVLTSSANPSVLGQTIQLTATVFPNSPTKPTGTVEFHEGPVFGTAPLVNGVATLNISSLALGTHIVTAQYTGDANYVPNIVSTVLMQVVGVPEIPMLDGVGFAALALSLAAAALLLIRGRG
jgi:hypothetical protein